MWFLIKGGFWFALVLVLLPFLVPGENKAGHDPAQVDMGATVSAATEALSYIGALCVQKPDVCEKGSETVTVLGQRARDGARIAYEFLDKQFAGGEATVTTGTVPAGQAAKPHTAAPHGAAAQDTATREAHGEPARTAEAGGSTEAEPVNIPVPSRRIAPEGAL
ncbi:hypothetical protein BTR14_05495 [Rhizobium rhizosphaerae]|uniref:DUF5330 domain-containing protein n=1 Tax=Xaviernesmea rhizosphaerae TaxID=1672749 RepID=A0ABX3PGQ3_9HYPH|nr:DUF5330 domain-containing protein [Xaviernesmea rhizosphaerae]OQP87389.1 hypothetical protein BTR14_05495 [Xaviernesmea rhizosphaerae]